MYRCIYLKEQDYAPKKSGKQSGFGKEMHFTWPALYRIHVGGR